MDKVLVMKYTTNYILLAVLMLSCSLCLCQSGSRWAMEAGLQPQMTLLEKTLIIDPESRLGLDIHLMPSMRLGKRVSLLFPSGYRTVPRGFKDYTIEIGCFEDHKSSYTKTRQTDKLFYAGIGARVSIKEHYFAYSSVSLFAVLSMKYEEYGIYPCGELIPPSAISCECNHDYYTDTPIFVSVGFGRFIPLSQGVWLKTALEYTHMLTDYQTINEAISIRQLGISIGVRYGFGVEQ